MRIPLRTHKLKHHHKKKLSGGLFPEELQILTDESANENGTSCFKKIPICCKLLGVDSLNIREYLDYGPDGQLGYFNLQFILNSLHQINRRQHKTNQR